MTAIDERRRRRSQVLVQWRAGTTGRSRRVVGALAGTVLAVSATGLLAGCQGEPGAAAVVDGRTIPASDVRTAISELGPFLQGVTTVNVLSVLVQEPTVTALAEENGVGVSDEQARALLDNLAKENNPSAPADFTEPSLDVAKYSMSLSNLQGLPTAQDVSKELQARIDKLDVEVNPRFGTLGDGNVVAAPTPWPWIATTPTPEATAPADQSPTPTPTP